jgi:single-strand DNA-binding protein
MSGVNKAILIGNLGRDPEIRNLENGVKLARFSLATTETYKDKDGNRTEQTEWHNIIMWRGLADVAERFLKKGNTIYVEGRIRTRSWQDENGNTRYTTEIQADNMTMLGGRRDAENTPAPPVASNQVNEDQPKADENTNDDLPF